MAGLRMVRLTEAQRVHCRDRASAHGEDVAKDAADAGRRTLVGLDIGGVVVALHLEDDAIAVVDVDDAGIFARSLDDARSLGRQGAQPLLRGLVGAVLVPHRRENAELGECRLAADQIEDALVFIGLQAVRGNEFRGDRDGVGNGHGSAGVLADNGFGPSLAQVMLSCDRKMPAVHKGSPTKCTRFRDARRRPRQTWLS